MQKISLRRGKDTHTWNPVVDLEMFRHALLCFILNYAFKGEGGFEYMCHQNSYTEKRKNVFFFLKRFIFVIIYAVTKSVSTKQLKVDRKDWKHGSIKGTEI